MMHPLVVAVMEADGYVGNRPRPINHGTRGGAKAHRRRGEDPCQSCRDADNEYLRRAKATYRRQRALAR